MLAVVACAVCLGSAVAVARPLSGGRRRRLARVGRSGTVAVGRSRTRRRVRGASPDRPALTVAEVALLADQVASLATAGLAPQRIWAAVAEHGPSPAARAVAVGVTAQGRRGVPPAQALRTQLLVGAGGLRGAACSAAVQLAVAVDVSERTGAATAPTLQRFAEALRADDQAAEERAAVLAGPQATASVLAVLPLAGLLLGALVGARPWHALLATSAGRGCLVIGGLLWLIGRRWTAHLVRRAADVT